MITFIVLYFTASLKRLVTIVTIALHLRIGTFPPPKWRGARRQPAPKQARLPISSFPYEPLNRHTEIRVVTLESGSKDDPVRCKIKNVDFTHRYEAVSYEWGPVGDTECIYVNGLPFMIRKNLHDALRHLRRSRWARDLWIDALSINQKDISEKNKQLRMMGTIYSQAWDTIVWLGPDRDDSNLAISNLKRIGQNSHNSRLVVTGDHGELYETEMRAVSALCSRTYWRRIWIVQEIRLTHQFTIYCGDKTIPGETFSLAIKIIKDASNERACPLLREIGDSFASKVVDYSQYQDLRIKDWLIRTREFLSSDQRDKVYALVNLATDCRGSNRFILDCSKTVSVSQVYKDVLKACCVDKLTRKPTYDIFDLSQEIQRALNTSSQTVQLTEADNDAIWICGIFSAQITSFQSDKTVSWSHDLSPKNISEGSNTAASTTSSNCFLNYDAGKSMTIIHKRRHSDAQAPVEIINDITIAPAPQMIQLEDALIELQAMCQSLNLKDSQYRSKPFRCSGQDCTGFAPSDAEIGDRICRFPGSRIGLLFRHPEHRDDSWRLVGTVILEKRFKISDNDMQNFWRGNPEHPESTSFGSDDACYLQLSMVTLQRLTAD